MRRASYRAGVYWIAMNDEPGEGSQEVVAGFISTLLLADLFGAEPQRVARYIIRRRRKEARRA